MLQAHTKEKGGRWPDGARSVFVFTVHMDGPAVEVGQGHVPLGIHSRGRYAVRRGVRRYLDMLDRLSMPATFFICGYDAEHYPELILDIHRAGHELAAHGYKHEAWDLGDEEPALLAKTHHIIADLTGTAPVGWCSPSGRKSALTIPTLKQLGYIYDASEKDEDLPYLLKTESGYDEDFVILPNNTVSLDDVPLFREGQQTAAEALENWEQELDAIAPGDGYIHFSIHPKAGPGSGTPARAAAVETFLRAAQRVPDLKVVTLEQLAQNCLASPAMWKEPRR